MIVYVCEQGAKVSREGERLIISSTFGERSIFVREIEHLVLVGNIHITTPAISVLLKRDIDVIFLQADGRYKGKLVGEESANVELRKRQFVLHDNEDFRLAIARSIIGGKLHNQAKMLAKIHHEKSCAETLDASHQLMRMSHEAYNMNDVNSLRGHEGAAAVVYFAHLRHGLKRDWGFNKRTRRPPGDAVNAVLSFLYGMLASRCHTACRIVGLDPGPGCVHSLEYGRKALPLDLMEEFRPFVCDALALAMFNLEMLNDDDFCDTSLEELEDGKRKGVYIRKEAMPKILNAFAKKMATSFDHVNAGRQMTYGEALVYQAGLYRKVIEGEERQYICAAMR